MIRALDHLVLPCPDLDDAVARYAVLGFIVGRRNRHPWGTENHIVQFDGCFLELIAMAPGAVPPPPADDAFPFAGFLAGRGATSDPSGMIVLRAVDAAEDAVAFAEAGIGAGRRLDFSRNAAGPDGAPRTVSFSLAFATAPAMPDLGFFTCRQHTPEAFWNPALQGHANGMKGIAAVVIAARDPAAHLPFLTRFTGAVAVATPDGFVLDLGNARLDIVNAVAAERLGLAQTPAHGARLAAIRFAGGSDARVSPGATAADQLMLLFG